MSEQIIQNLENKKSVFTARPNMGMHITLKQLDVYCAVVKALSFTQAAKSLNMTQAAKSLNMTQPAISAQIKNLEEQLDIKLFENVGKKLILTDAGLDIAKKVHALQNDIEAFKQHILNIKGLRTGKLHISVPSSIQKPIFLILKNFYAKYPHIEIETRVIDHSSQLRLLQENRIDFCIMTMPLKKSSFYSDILFSYGNQVIAPPNYPLANKHKISVETLRNETFIVGEPQANSQRILEEKIVNGQMKLLYVHNTDSVKYAVEAGLGLAIVAENSLDKALYNKNYAVLDVIGFPIKSHAHLVHRHKKLLSPIALEFKNFAHAYCQAHLALA